MMKKKLFLLTLFFVALFITSIEHVWQFPFITELVSVANVNDHFNIGRVTLDFFSLYFAGTDNDGGKAFATIDTTKPLVTSAMVTPSIVGTTAQITITKTVTDNVAVNKVTAEIIGPSPSKTAIGSIALLLVSGNAQSGTWSGVFTFPSQAMAPDGTYTIVNTATDTSNNAVRVTDGTVILDRTAPTVSIVSIVPNLQKPGGTVTVTASASDTRSGISGLTARDLTIGEPAVPMMFIDGSTAPGGTSTWNQMITAMLPEGSHTVQVVANDNAIPPNSNTVTGSFTVDATPPMLSVPSDITAGAASSAGVVVLFTASASDAVDGAITPTCSPPSGSTFPLGSTTVNCSATDAAGNTGSASFNVTVEDTTPPTIDAHGDVTAEATSAVGAIVTYTSPATHDAVDGDGTANCLPASNSQFALGDTTVTCNATDAHHNPATSTTFMVHVVDTTKPIVTVPADITREATSASGAAVTFTASASDAVDGAITPTCSPPSGSTFPLGLTTVTCTASDASGNTGSASFNVTVLTLMKGKQDTIVALQNLKSQTTNKQSLHELDEAIDRLTKSVDPTLWQPDGVRLDAKKGEKVFDNEKEAVQHLMQIVKDKKETTIGSLVQGTINKLVDLDRKLAQVAINDASTLTDDKAVKEVAKANEEMGKASGKISDGKFNEAIEHYKNAWKHAQEAIKHPSPPPKA